MSIKVIKEYIDQAAAIKQMDSMTYSTEASEDILYKVEDNYMSIESKKIKSKVDLFEILGADPAGWNLVDGQSRSQNRT